MMSEGAEKNPSKSPAPVVASVADLQVHFQSKRGIVHAVDGVSFDIHDGETLGLVGETGCGKSVTARSFLRLVPKPPGIDAGGSILFRPRTTCDACEGRGCESCHQTGRVSAGCSACSGKGCSECVQSGEETLDLMQVSNSRMRSLRGDRIAMIFQDPGKALNPALTIGSQIAEVFYQHRSAEVLDAANVDVSGIDPGSLLLKRQAAQQSRTIERTLLKIPPLRSRRNQITAAVDDMVADALAETQIANPRKIMQRYPHELSGGMRQRVMIAQALACNPDLLIADEPTTALDVTVQARILELIHELQQRRQTAVLYISHDLSLVRRICDRVAVMYAGRIVEISDADQIFQDPRHPYTRGLLAALPSATQSRGKLAAIEGTVPELVDPTPSCRFSGRCPNEVETCARFDPHLQSVGDEHSVACFIYHEPPEGSGGRPTLAARSS
ncbi:MAG: ATP-binding cassette domain-containing protein [Alphaproteobacteria bacterium]|nr:ATP-binding cassette domain-containing protein [Alphaproteobacteria bacterium]